MDFILAKIQSWFHQGFHVSRRRQPKKNSVKKKKIKRYPPTNNLRPVPNVSGGGPPDHWFLRQFWPEFEELPVGLMGYSLILLTIFDGGFQDELLHLLFSTKAWLYFLFYLMIFYVILKSLYHVFSNCEKTREEKKSLLGFAAFCCILTGIFGGARLYMNGQEGGWLQILGLYNLLQGFTLGVLVRFEIIDESSFSDRETPFWGAITNFLAVTTLFLFLKFWHSFYWVDNFAILVAYAMTFASPLCDLMYYRPVRVEKNA